MSTTRRTASSSRARTTRKCRVSPHSAAAKTMPQRSRTAAAVSSCEGPSVVESTTPDAAELLRVGDPRRRKVACGFLCLDFDRGVERHQPVWNRDLLDDLDALSG